MTTRLSSSRFGLQVTAVPNIYTIYPQHFSIPESSETLRGSPTKIFATVRQKIFDSKSWYSRTPRLIHKLFRYRKFSETQHRRIPLRNFSALWDKKVLTENRDTPHPLLSINFLDTRTFVKQKGPLMKFFGPVRQKIFGKIMMPPSHSYAWKFSIQEFFLKHRRGLLRKFSVLWDKNFRHKIVISPSDAKNFFDNRNFPTHWIVPHQYFSVPWDKSFERKVVIPPLFH